MTTTTQAPASPALEEVLDGKRSAAATAAAPTAAPDAPLRPLFEIRPPEIFRQLNQGVLGQDRALRFVSVAVYKHTTGRVSANILLVGNSGTGKTTIMNNIQRLYDTVPEYRPFRALTIMNANLLVDSDRTEFRPDRLFSSVEQRARLLLDERPTAAELKEAMERATVCIDEIDKMSSVLAGKPNPLGVVLQQGLLTLMEGEKVHYRTHAWEDGQEREVSLALDTSHMMFVCGGAFEGLYDQVYLRVTKPGSGQKLRSEAKRTAEGKVRIEQIFSLAEFLKIRDLFEYGMVPQFMARFDKLVLMNDLGRDVLEEILLHSYDSPFVRSQRFFETLGIELGMEDLAAALIAEAAAKETRTGARALREIFSEIINPFEYDPWGRRELVEVAGAEPDAGGHRLQVTAEMARKALRR